MGAPGGSHGRRRAETGTLPLSLCPPCSSHPMAVKEEPCDEDPPGATKAARGPPGFPRDIPVAELLQRLSLAAEDELLFLQLPDTLPGQPPTQDTKPIKTELQTEEGQVVVVKQEKSQVIGVVLGWFCGFCGDFVFFFGWFWGFGGGFVVFGMGFGGGSTVMVFLGGRRRGRRRTRAPWPTSPRGRWGSCWSASRGRCSWCWAR